MHKKQLSYWFHNQVKFPQIRELLNENFALKLAASLGDDDAMIGSVRYSF